MTSEPVIARKVGEGVGAPNAEQELPIDINYMKIIDFLVSESLYSALLLALPCTRSPCRCMQVSRQKLPSDWHKRVQAISRKAVEAIKETPGPVLSSLSDGADAPVDYFRAVQIRDKLAATCERTLFGGLTGAAAVWDKVVKAYENKCESGAHGGGRHMACTGHARGKGSSGACVAAAQQSKGGTAMAPLASSAHPTETRVVCIVCIQACS